MKYTKLNNEQQAEMKRMVKDGITPKEIIDHFNEQGTKVAISTVHNFKKQWREEGVSIPEVKGKRKSSEVIPSGQYEHRSQTRPSHGSNSRVHVAVSKTAVYGGSIKQSKDFEEDSNSIQKSVYYINNVKIEITGEISGVITDKDKKEMRIIF